MLEEMNNTSEVNQYVCTNLIQDELSSEILKQISEIQNNYEIFINQIENFFNSNIESQNDFDLMKGDIVELSDASENFFIPFKKQNGKLKFMESETWRTIIITAILNVKATKKT